MSERRETIHVSFGRTSNAVTAHLLNLEGLSATCAGADSPICDPLVTHQIDTENQVWVPRVLLVDEAHRIQPQRAAVPNISNNGVFPAANEAAASVWSGTVKEFSVESFSIPNFTEVGNVVANLSYNANESIQQSQNHQAPWLSSWKQTASQLAYAPYSQYRVSAEDQYAGHHQKQKQTEPARHVNWDELGEEPNEETEELRERQRLQQIQRWDEERLQLEDQLSTFWVPSSSTKENNVADGQQKTASVAPLESDLDGLSWMDYWMPPYSPLTQCTYSLPSTSTTSSFQSPPLHSYNIASNSQSIDILDKFWEKLRLQLERTDTCQGFTIMTEDNGMYAAMTTWLLQELQQECRAAGRWVFHVVNEEDDVDAPKAEEVESHQENAVSSQTRRQTELSMTQARVRNRIQQGLALAGLSDHAHILLPLVLPSRSKHSLFRSSAELAMALETAALPYRCQASSDATLVGWNSISAYEEGAAPNRMSLRDYLATLQPAPRYSLLELDTVLTSSNRQRLGQSLLQGTSVERDPRMREPPRSWGTEHPGSWLLDSQFVVSPYAPPPGILTSCSPGHVAQQDRSLHHHFGLSTCLRRGMSSNNPLLSTNQQYLTCVMEGMGIRFRPETAFGLVTRGFRFGAGSYWNYLFGGAASENCVANSMDNPLLSVLANLQNAEISLVNKAPDIPVLSVLGNSTRMYPYLHSTATGMKGSLKSSRTRGYYEREASNGTLPEMEDCDQALEYCWDLRDVYEPPHGSGIADGDDEEYFGE
jgi:hypothetical protein